MARADFTVVNTDSTAQTFVEELVPGSLSGSGKYYLRLSNGAQFGTSSRRDFYRNGVSLDDVVVESYFRLPSNLGWAGLIARATSLSPLTGYALFVTEDFVRTKLYRFNSGTKTLLVDLGPVFSAGSIQRVRLIVNGNIDVEISRS